MFMNLGWDKRINRPLNDAVSLDGVFHAVTRPFAGQTRKCVLNLASVKNLSCLQKYRTGSEAHPALCSMDTERCFTVDRAGVKFKSHVHLVPRLRMNGAVPPLLRTPSRIGEEQRYAYLYTSDCAILNSG